MAKARNITPVRNRAIAAWFKATGIAKDDPHLKLWIWKSRSNKTITVRANYLPASVLTWSYKGGSLRKIGA